MFSMIKWKNPHKILFSLCEYYCFMAEIYSNGYVKHIKHHICLFWKNWGIFKNQPLLLWIFAFTFKGCKSMINKPMKTSLLEQFSVENNKIWSLKMCHYYASTVKSSISGFPDETERELCRNAMRIV